MYFYFGATARTERAFINGLSKSIDLLQLLMANVLVTIILESYGEIQLL